MSPGAKHKELMAAMPAPLRNAHSAFPIKAKTFLANDLEYPRAGVRQQVDGKWLLQIWYSPNAVRIDRPAKIFGTRAAAVNDGRREVHALRSRRHPAGQLHLRGTGAEATA